jgi:hypothetical protein
LASGGVVEKEAF